MWDCCKINYLPILFIIKEHVSVDHSGFSTTVELSDSGINGLWLHTYSCDQFTVGFSLLMSFLNEKTYIDQPQY